MKEFRLKINALKTMVLIFVLLGIIGCNNTESQSTTEQQTQQQEEAVKTTLSDDKLKIIGDKVNIRSAAAPSSKVIGQENTGATFKITDRSDVHEAIGQQTDYWYEIEREGKPAWVFGAFTSKNLNDNEQHFTGIYDGTEQGDHFHIYFIRQINDEKNWMDFGEGYLDNNFSKYDLIEDEEKYKGKKFEITWKVILKSTYAGEGSTELVEREAPVILNLKLVE